MTGLHKWRYLRPATSESEEDLVRAPDSNSSFDEAMTQTCNQLMHGSFKSAMDQRLWNQVVLKPKDV